MLKGLAIFVLSFALSASAAPASAGEILFQIVGTGLFPDQSATFELPPSPVPDSNVAGQYFIVDSVPAKIGDNEQTNLGPMTFYAAPHGGLTAGGLYDLRGDQLYTGGESDPTFTPGVYTLANSVSESIDFVTLTAVPESSTWAMLLMGFAGLGLGRYRRARRRAAGNARKQKGRQNWRPLQSSLAIGDQPAATGERLFSRRR